MDPLSLIGFAGGLVGGIGKIFGRGAANRQLKRLLAKDPIYSENPEVRARLGLAKTLLNARAPGAAMAERNIYTSNANATASAENASTDSSQLLATAGEIQGNTNDAFNNLGQQETADYQRRYNNVGGAQQDLVNEQDKVFQDKVRRFQNEAEIRGAITNNKQSGWGDISNLGFGLMNFGLAGGFNKMFGGAGGGGYNPQMNFQSNPTSFAQIQGYPNVDPRQAGSSYRGI